MATAPGIEGARLPHWRGLSLSDFGNYWPVPTATLFPYTARLRAFFLAQWQRPATTGALKDQAKPLALPLCAGIDRRPGELTEAPSDGARVDRVDAGELGRRWQQHPASKERDYHTGADSRSPISEIIGPYRQPHSFPTRRASELSF